MDSPMTNHREGVQKSFRVIERTPRNMSIARIVTRIKLRGNIKNTRKQLLTHRRRDRGSVQARRVRLVSGFDYTI